MVAMQINAIKRGVERPVILLDEMEFTNGAIAPGHDARSPCLSDVVPTRNTSTCNDRDRAFLAVFSWQIVTTLKSDSPF
jgi:hypothetical protein